MLFLKKLSNIDDFIDNVNLLSAFESIYVNIQLSLYFWASLKEFVYSK